MGSVHKGGQADGPAEAEADQSETAKICEVNLAEGAASEKSPECLLHGEVLSGILALHQSADR